MKRVTLQSVGILHVLTVSALAHAVPQPPHHYANGVGCSDCHVPYGGGASADSGSASSGSTLVLVDDSKSWTPGEWVGGVISFTSGGVDGAFRNVSANTATQISFGPPLPQALAGGETYSLGKTTESDIEVQCKSCHQDGGQASSMADVSMHQALGGTVTIGCGKCHEPHNVDPNTGQGQALLRMRPRWPGANQNIAFPSGYPNNPYVVRGAPYNGICEVCHTQTAYHCNSAAGTHGHNADTGCTGCHGHGESFGEVDCTSCHGYPPVDPGSLVTSDPTGSSIAGAHSVHSNQQGYACSLCHSGAAGAGAMHDTGMVSVGFELFGSYLGGDYDGQIGVNYEASEASTTLTATGSTTCDNVYCHGKEPDGTVWGGGSSTTPSWTDTGTTCSDCHDAAGASTALSGMHASHVDGTGMAIVECERCHDDTAQGSTAIKDRSYHADGTLQVTFSAGGTFDKPSGDCDNTWCHSDAAGGPARVNNVDWQNAASPALNCLSCHNGKAGEAYEMATDGHDRLVGSGWIREYPCSYCHAATVDPAGQLTDLSKHANETKDVVMPSQWWIAGKPAPSYDSNTKVCLNVYCHSDGTSVNPEVRDFAWDAGRTKCNTCHGHPAGDCSDCHDDGRPGWPPGDEWKESVPMYINDGSGTERANTHERHLLTDFACDNCHYRTVVNGNCTDCHVDSIPLGSMGEVEHIDPTYHVNKLKDVYFKDGGSYDPVTKTCANTTCHTGSDPTWGDSVESAVLCFECHGTTEADVDDFLINNGARARINMTEWQTTGHGRPTALGNYVSGNPPANFPGNPCWYCHDNEVLHNVASNPFRLKLHPQFDARFEKECVYCHMEGLNSECYACHEDAESLAPQLPAIAGHAGYVGGGTVCSQGSCHDSDATTHKTNAGLWTATEKADVKNQYVMMGVCLRCHEDDSNNACQQCHTGAQYQIGYDPGPGLITGVSKATSTHFGFKHFEQFQNEGKWKGGKFCWDCHDAHGDTNIYMMQDKVSTETDGTFGRPLARADVVFDRKQTGQDYVSNGPPYDGLCNVCHTDADHYGVASGDGHNAGRICTECHEHRFLDSHASGQNCVSCHQAKPIPRHTGFSQPRDCIKCHDGVIGDRMDILGQLRANSHHIQGPDATARHCYACHWEANDVGLLDETYHQGYKFSTHETTPDADVDLVIWGPGVRPSNYSLGSTAVIFTASKIGTPAERGEVTKVSEHCLGCHNDANNDTYVFGMVDPLNDDCKTPRQYAWDGTSVDARYSQTGTTSWGKYTGVANAAKKDVVKAYSAHGKAPLNHGGWDAVTGEDGVITDTRGGTEPVQCFDCHSSHGSKTSGVTSSYATFNGTYNGANLKETQAGKGGYFVTYKAAGSSSGVNPMAAGAAQCFDCHETATAGSMPWGYQGTFGSSAPIMGYRDGARFDDGPRGVTDRYAFKAGMVATHGHLNPSAALDNAPMGTIDGLCAPCHDPHGVSPTLGANQEYAVPLLKGTWLTSPYKEDVPIAGATTGAIGSHRYDSSRNKPVSPVPDVYLDQMTFGTGRAASTPIASWYLQPGETMIENEEQFAGLCLGCHPRSNLEDEEANNTAWKSRDRIHETVKGWGDNQMHAFSCSKCHSPHSSGLPRLLRTGCLDISHRGRVTSGGAEGSRNGSRGEGSFPLGGKRDGTTYRVNCHPGAAWPDNDWNSISDW